MRRLSFVGPITVLILSLLTLAITTLGPTPYRISTHPHILDVGNVLVEPVDRIVLISWWLVPIALGLVLWFAGRGRLPMGRATGPIGWAVGAIAVLVAAAQVLLDEDEIGLYPGISLGALILGAGATVVLLMSWYAGTAVAKATTILLLIPLAIVSLAAAFQTPDGVTETDSFRYTSDELAAPANGQLPLGTFFPQYSSLLGLPIAPLLRALPEQSLWIILLWLLALQAVTVLLAIRLPVRVSGWRMLLPAAAVILLPLVATRPSVLNGTSYFAGLPMRLVLPMVAVTVALAVTAADAGHLGPRMRTRYALLGGVVGVTVLNNLDFGAPAGLAIMVAVALHTPDQRLARIGYLLIGAAVPLVVYGAVGAAAGQPVHWASAVTFARVFGAEGYFNVAMQPYGLHVVFAALFGSATLIGAIILLSRGIPRQAWVRRQGFLLLVVGLWSLLSLAYFSGRSYTATLQGHALQASLVVACFLPLLRVALRRLRLLPAAERSWATASVALLLLAMAACLASLTLVHAPWVHLNSLSARAPGPATTLAQQVASLERAVAADPTAAGALRRGELEQMLDRPALTALLSGIPSRVVVNNPGYFAVSTRFAALQCARLQAEQTSLVILDPALLAPMARDALCAEVLDIAAAYSISESPRLVAVPVRHPPR